MRYQGPAHLDAVLAHYADGFSQLGFARTDLPAEAAAPARVLFRRGEEVVRLAVQAVPRGEVKVSLVTGIPR